MNQQKMSVPFALLFKMNDVIHMISTYNNEQQRQGPYIPTLTRHIDRS